MTYELLDHTADIGFRAVGETLGEAFENATKAFADIVDHDEPPEPTNEREVTVESEDLEALLFDYLAHLVYVQDVQDVLVLDADLAVQVDDGGRARIEGVLLVRPRTNRGYLDVKAPTYNGMVVEEDGEDWTLEAVLDI